MHATIRRRISPTDGPRPCVLGVCGMTATATTFREGFQARVSQVTVVTPVFNEEQSLGTYEERVRATLLDRTDYDVRVLLVDDGSRDQSWPLIQQICRRDSRFQGLRLSRNFGSHAALAAGLHHAAGDVVAILACDLQDPPEVVLEFLEKWRAGGQIVWGRRRTRADSRWRIW